MRIIAPECEQRGKRAHPLLRRPFRAQPHDGRYVNGHAELVEATCAELVEAVRGLARSIFLRCPCPLVAGRLATIVGTGGRGLSLAVRGPVRLASLDAEIVLSQATIVSLNAPAAGAGAGFVTVAWEPGNGDTFPHFTGRLWPEAHTLCTTLLRLEGDYETMPQRLRLVERGERAIGYRLALATAKALLDAMAEAIMRRRTASVA